MIFFVINEILHSSAIIEIILVMFQSKTFLPYNRNVISQFSALVKLEIFYHYFRSQTQTFESVFPGLCIQYSKYGQSSMLQYY